MKNLQVLLVDDEEGFASALADRLRMRGLGVEVELNGEGALKQVEDKAFDVLVVDLLMPGMDGLTLMKKIKSAGREIPVILLTGHGSSKDGIDGMKQGAFDYMMKPVDFDALLSKIIEAGGSAE